jgi:hypothetical protein
MVCLVALNIREKPFVREALFVITNRAYSFHATHYQASPHTIILLMFDCFCVPI